VTVRDSCISGSLFSQTVWDTWG